MEGAKAASLEAGEGWVLGRARAMAEGWVDREAERAAVARSREVAREGAAEGWKVGWAREEAHLVEYLVEV